ncbi:MAG: HAMP domain-containing sensor histidine kinase [Patescibacteria group bacterium]|jgi:hypothetical protein
MNDLIDKGGIAHRLRTPLNGLIGFLSLLKDGYHSLSEEERIQYIAFCHTGANNLLELLNELISLARMTSAGVVDYKEVNIHDELAKVLEMANPQIVEKELVIEEVDTDINISSSPVMVGFILQNLIDNAVKFSYEKGLVLVKATPVEEDQKKFLEISVTDHGAGMTAYTQTKIFHEVHSTKGAYKEPGNGIGLFGCVPLIHKLGGKIWGESAGEKQGSTFHFTLPIVIAKPK